MRSLLSTGSPSKSGVVGTGKNDASGRVLLTGLRRGETATTKVETKEQQAQSDNDSTEGAREDELKSNDASDRPARRVTMHVPACHPVTLESCVRFRTRKAA